MQPRAILPWQDRTPADEGLVQVQMPGQLCKWCSCKGSRACYLHDLLCASSSGRPAEGPLPPESARGPLPPATEAGGVPSPSAAAARPAPALAARLPTQSSIHPVRRLLDGIWGLRPTQSSYELLRSLGLALWRNLWAIVLIYVARDVLQFLIHRIVQRLTNYSALPVAPLACQGIRTSATSHAQRYSACCSLPARACAQPRRPCSSTPSPKRCSTRGGWWSTRTFYRSTQVQPLSSNGRPCCRIAP